GWMMKIVRVQFELWEYRRLVHVIPKAANALIQMPAVQRTKPCSHFKIQEIRKSTLSWPDAAPKLLAICSPAEVIASLTFLIYSIVLIDFHSRVDDCNQANARLSQISG